MFGWLGLCVRGCICVCIYIRCDVMMMVVMCTNNRHLRTTFINLDNKTRVQCYKHKIKPVGRVLKLQTQS